MASVITGVRALHSLATVLSILVASASLAAGQPEPAAFERETALARSQAAIGRSVRDGTFYDTQGLVRRLSEYRGKPLVVSLIYTSCHHICPATTQHLAKVVANARDVLGEDSFRVVTVGFDTAHDTADAMRAFARQQHVELADWDFLAGDRPTVDALVEDLGFLYYPAPHGFDHLIQSSIVDANGVVFRQVYGIRFEVPHLIEPLKVLVFGGDPTGSLLDQLGARIKLFCTVYDPASDRYLFDYSIFVGVVIGISLGGVFVFFVLREWRKHREHLARARQPAIPGP